MPLTQEQLRGLAKLGADRRVAELEKEIVALEASVAERLAEIDEIRSEFKEIKRTARTTSAEDGEDGDVMSREELKGEIGRVLAAAAGAVINSERLASAIQAHNPTKRIALKRSPASRVSMQCNKMASVKRRENGWVWNPVDDARGPRALAR